MIVFPLIIPLKVGRGFIHSLFLLKINGYALYYDAIFMTYKSWLWKTQQQWSWKLESDFIRKKSETYMGSRYGFLDGHQGAPYSCELEDLDD